MALDKNDVKRIAAKHVEAAVEEMMNRGARRVDDLMEEIIAHAQKRLAETAHPR